MQTNTPNNTLARSFYFVAFLAIIIYSLTTLSSLLSTIAVAFIICFLINALASKIQTIPLFKYKIPETLSIILSIFIISLILIKVGSFVGQSIIDLGGSLEGIDTKLKLFLEQMATKYDFIDKINISKLLEQLSISSIINKIIGLFSEVLGNSVQILLYVLFIILDQKLFSNKLKALFGDGKNYEKMNHIVKTISANIKTYIYITTTISMATGFATYLACTFFEIQGAGLWGFLALVLNFIPTIGSIIAVLVPATFALITIDINSALLLIPILGAVQFLLGNVLQPKLMGDKLNISQFVVILSLVVWGMMWGTVGMFLSIPIMVILSIIFAQFESTKVFAILISSDGRIASGDSSVEVGRGDGENSV